MDEETRKIVMVIEAFDAEHARLHQVIQGFNGSADRLALTVRQAANSAVEDALQGLHPHIDRAGKTLQGLQRFSVWRAAWQHAMVAAVAIAMTLLAVWWYVPPLSEMTELRAEREQLQASIDELDKRGGRMKLKSCGPNARLCVLIDRAAGGFGNDKAETYMIVKGY